jgi:FMN phosphatase YigB (HAD superfamily)
VHLLQRGGRFEAGKCGTKAVVRPVAERQQRRPDPEFFARIIDAAHVPAPMILYVETTGWTTMSCPTQGKIHTALIGRGPWGFLHARHPEAAVADVQIHSLHELAADLSGSRSG